MADIYAKEHLDLVFEKRNKDYGAYVIRQRYEKTILIALLVSVIILSFAVAIPYISALLDKFNANLNIEDDVQVELMDAPPLDEDVPPPPPPPVPPPPVMDMVKFTPPVVVDKAVEEEIPPQEELKTENVGTKDQEGDKNLIDVPDEGNGVIDEGPSNEIFTFVEQMPGFPGGDAKLYEYLSKNLKYTNMAREAGIQGKVFVTFVVEPNGSITNVQILRGLGGGLNEEAIKVVKNMPAWSPGKQNGRAVKVQVNLPIQFKLSG